jgi:hypothetical protein
LILAEKTLKAIHDGIMADGGASFRVWQGRVLPHIHDAYSGEAERGQRSHLGASQIGKECDRAIYYGFRWVGEDTKTPAEKEEWSRKLRLFNRGHLEEGRFIAMLRSVEIRVTQQDRSKKQYRFVDHGGHYAGSIDGVVQGCPDSPDGTVGLIEFKTYNDKRFKDLVKNGVKENDETYFVQLQQYMMKMGLTWALFMAVSKNDDSLHAEIIPYDPETAARYRKRAIDIILAPAPPAKLRGASAAYFKCKWCDFKQKCHLGRPADENCRTCKHSLPVPEMDTNGKGIWRCGLVGIALTKEDQQAGCEHYEQIPHL